MKKIQLIFFDNDGVFTPETADFHFQKINAFGHALSREEYENISLGNWHEEIKSVPLGSINTEAYINFILEDYAKIKIPHKSRELIERLATQCPLVIVSSGSEHVIEPYLKSNRVRECFSSIRAKEQGVSKTEKFLTLLAEYQLDPDQTLFVTDSLGDIHEAQRCGIPTIGISWGVHSREVLERGKPLAIISEFSELEFFV